MNVDAAFGHWLAGLIDGEGSFNLAREGSRFRPAFTLGLRGDDVAVIEEIEGTVGFGRIHHTTGTDHCPMVRWSVCSQADCLALVEMLDRCPLRSRKAVDYAIWRRAVQRWRAVVRTGAANPHVNAAVWADIAILRAELDAVRGRPMGATA